MNFNIREIEINDYYKKYFDLLSQLTYAENVEFKKWEKQIQKIRENPYHHIFVIEDKGKIIASITLLVEVKIIRNLGNIAHIEDLVVSNEYRGKGLASKLLEHLIEESKEQQHTNTQKVEELDYIQAARVLLQDDGIKTKIIKQYLPIMNQLINKYLASMDFFVNFKLDEEFNEKIRSRFRDEFSYLSFSEGEKMRIDLALLFTWRAVAKMKNSVSTNLLILDEIFDSSLDTTGTDDFLKILNTLKDENVFIISHKTDIMMDKFANQIHFEKHKNFTRIYEPWQIQ